MSSIQIFNRKIKSIHRDRASRNFPKYNFLINDISNNFIETLSEDINFKFNSILDLGGKSGLLDEFILSKKPQIFLKNAVFDSCSNKNSNDGLKVSFDEEFLPFDKESFDLVYSTLDLHWVNDLPGCLIQIKNILRKDGLFLCSILGGQTLSELRAVITSVESRMRDGAAPRISPMIGTKDAGALLQRAGFALPVVDSEVIKILYKDVKSLVADLRGMGETNALLNSANIPLNRSIWQSVEQEYKKKFSTDEGLIYATFEVLNLIGWKN